MKVQIFVLLLAICWAIQPACQILQQSDIKVYNTPDELQALNLSRYFRGYNLEYKTNVDSPDFTLIPPFYNNNAKDLPNPVKNGSSRVAIDILTDSNLAWREQGASLILNNNNSFTVSFGDLTPDLLLDFNNDVQVPLDLPMTCFDLAMLDTNMALVDCQTNNASATVTDRHYLVNGQTKTATPLNFQAIVFTTKRKTFAYRVDDSTFIMSAVLYEGVKPTFNESTYISVYYVDPDTHKTSLINVLDASTLGTDKLSITDLAVDQNGFIYVTHVSNYIYRFRYMASNKISQLSTFTYGGVSNTFLKVAALSNSNGSTTVVVAAQGFLIELRWNKDEVKVNRYYNITEVSPNYVDLQINSQMIMVQTSTDYYFLRIGVTDFKNLLYTAPTLSSIGVLCPTIPQSVVVGNLTTRSYIVSSGYLEVMRPKINQTVAVTATSKTADSSINCTVSFLVTVVDDTTKAYVLRDPPTKKQQENPATLDFVLSDYFIGPLLQYKPHPASGTQYSLKHIEQLRMDGVKAGYRLFDTYTLNQAQGTFIRLSENGKSIQIDRCQIDFDNKVSCKAFQTIDTFGRPVAYSVFRLSTIVENPKLLIAYVSDSNQGTVSFREVGGTAVYKDLVISQDYAVSDLDATTDFLYVTSQQASSVYVYRILQNVYNLIHTLNRQNIRKVVPNITVFKPRELGVSPVDQNVLFIKNIDSILILKVTTSRISYISNIITQSDPLETVSERIVVGRENFLLIRAKSNETQSRIVEYGIYDIYKPLLMREITLIGDDVAWPVKMNNNFGSDFVYVRTVSKTGQQYSVTAIRMARPALGSNYARFSTQANSGFASYDLFSQSIIQIDTDSGATLSNRIYYEPRLQVMAVIQDSTFKKNFNYGLTVSTPSSDSTVDSTIEVVNFQAPIKPSGQTTTIKLPAAANNLEVEVDLDDWFVGSVAEYSIRCPACSTDKIKLSNHFAPVSELNIRANDYLQFQSNKIFWVLTPTTIMFTGQDGKNISEYKLDVEPTANCQNMLKWNANTVLVFCFGVGEQSFRLLKASDDKTGIVSSTKFIVEPTFWINSLLAITSDNQGRIFILDNTAQADGKGSVVVFKVTSDGTNVKINGQTIIRANDFGASEGSIINDIDIIDTPATPARKMFLVTLSLDGIGWGLFDPAASTFSLLPIQSILLNNNKILSDFQLDYNVYLQNEILDMNATPQAVIYHIVLTNVHGEHFDLQLSFKPNNKTFYDFDNFWLFNTYNKYGNEEVLNWAQSQYFGDESQQSYLMAAVYDATLKNTAYTLYRLSTKEINATQHFKGALTVEPNANNKLPALNIFSTTSKSMLVWLFHPKQAKTVLYKIEQKLKLSFNYNSIDQFGFIDVVASNFLSSSTQRIAIEWNTGPQPGKDGIKWWVIVLIAIGVLAVIGIVLVYYIRARKNRLQGKESLLTEAGKDIDEQV